MDRDENEARVPSPDADGLRDPISIGGMRLAQEVRRRPLDERRPHERKARRCREESTRHLHRLQRVRGRLDPVVERFGKLPADDASDRVEPLDPRKITAAQDRGSVRRERGRAPDESHPTRRRVRVSRRRRLLEIRARARSHDANARQMAQVRHHSAAAVVQSVIVRRPHDVVAEPSQLLGDLRVHDDAQARARGRGVAFVPAGHHELAVAERAVRALEEPGDVEKPRIGQHRDPPRQDDVAGECEPQHRLRLREGAPARGRSGGEDGATSFQERSSVHSRSLDSVSSSDLKHPGACER
jgi:hypothetical protein